MGGDPGWVARTPLVLTLMVWGAALAVLAARLLG